MPLSTPTTSISTGGITNAFLNETNKSASFSQQLSVVVIGLTVGTLIVATVVGNLLVCVTVFLVRKLRHPSNFLLVALAVADCAVGLLVMPFAGLYEMNDRWELGDLACNFWTSSDVLLCTASILNLCAISVDRYWTITKPLQYGPNRTTKRMLMYILTCWVLAFLISLVPQFIFKNSNDSGTCQVNQNVAYQIYATMGAFYIPVAIMLLLNFKIYRAAKRLARLDRKCSAGAVFTDGNSTAEATTTLTGTPESRRLQQPPENCHRGLFGRTAEKFRFPPHNNHDGNGQNYFGAESKATKTLGIIMGAFITCWLPFFLIALIKPLCGAKCDVPKWLDSLALWLGYCNSLINPGIYAKFNRDFRIPFR